MKAFVSPYDPGPLPLPPAGQVADGGILDIPVSALGDLVLFAVAAASRDAFTVGHAKIPLVHTIRRVERYIPGLGRSARWVTGQGCTFTHLAQTVSLALRSPFLRQVSQQITLLPGRERQGRLSRSRRHSCHG